MLFLVALQNYKPIINTIHNTPTPLSITVASVWWLAEGGHGVWTRHSAGRNYFCYRLCLHLFQNFYFFLFASQLDPSNIQHSTTENAKCEKIHFIPHQALNVSFKCMCALFY